SKLLKDLSKHPELLAGAVEYAFQRGDIDSKEYRNWQRKIAEMERQHTAKLLATIKA
nr:hypothetical protein [Acinetobacter baumannii]EKU7194058.1 hypothetical protein [Acinetobacter baumannii]EKV9540480.1 hypothetical protein [Acinetobacter baumannii]EKW1147134.1 hypothetical protein [Acinetobacter baumannii]ELB0354626.1 hypothetical protein [Acinetobacter baumannii]